MNPFKKLFGGDSKKAPSPPRAAPEDPAADPNLIRVYDAYGRELFLTRQQWRDSVLLGNVEQAWNDPEHLASLVIQSLQDEFFEEMIKPAERLAAIDPDPERSAVLLAIVYLKVGRVDDSEKVLRAHVEKHGKSGVVLTNLAKVHAERGDHPRSMETLWRALQLDPNQDNAVGWYEAAHREEGGPAAGVEALRRIAALPGSWRAQVWLARAALQTGGLDEAMGLYRKTLAATGDPAPGDLLMQMSGDLGNAGHLDPLLDLVLPRYRADVHGLPVGNNLIKALVDRKDVERAASLLQELYALGRPDWKPTLGYWDTEIAKARLASRAALPAEKLSIRMLGIDGPIWLPVKSPARELFELRPAGALTVSFIGSSAETGRRGEAIVAELSDAPGRLSRALPLFLAEQVHFGTGAGVRTSLPWVEGAGGFVVSGARWQDADAVRYSVTNAPCDHVVVTHLHAASDPWRVELRLLRPADSSCVGTAEAVVPLARPQDGLPTLAARLLAMLSGAGSMTATRPASYQVPRDEDFADYLLRLEQLLAVRCAGMEGVPGGFLSGEREILDGNIHLCLRHPRNATTRVLLLQTVKAMRRVRPRLVEEYREKLETLQREHPLAGPALGATQRLLEEALAGD